MPLSSRQKKQEIKVKLFVANATKKTIDFVYRTSIGGAIRSQHIPIGGQVQLSGELAEAEIAYVIESYEKYGIIDASKVNQVQTLVGLCYSVGKPVTNVAIEKLIVNNIEELVALGQRIRQECAITTSDMLNNALDEAGGEYAPNVNKFEMSVVEQDGGDIDYTPISEGTRVERDPNAQRHGKQRRGRR